MATRNVFTPVVATALLAQALPVPGTDNRIHVQYELQIVNAKAAPATITSVDILSADDTSTLIAGYDSAQVVDSLRSTLPKPVADAVIPPGELRFLYIEVSFATAADIPSGVVHRFNLLAAANPGTDQPTPMQYEMAPVEFPSTPPLALAPPLSGAGWIDFNGAFNNLTVHRGSVQTVNGQFFIAQRYAIDYMRLNDAGQIVAGDPADVTANVAYGSDILAVADSTVVEVLDELPDQPPGKLPDPSAITMDTVDGNHIVLDLGGGLYGFYAHLQRGSVLVKPGQRVSTGEVMAKLGNSGNTSGPHLHFHVMDGPSVLGSEGQPYVITSFQTAGTIDPAQFDATNDFTGNWAGGRGTPVEQTDKFPMNLQILNFPT
ncbi:MAG: M23 family metallopeptidase [Nakamurella sp.]